MCVFLKLPWTKSKFQIGFDERRTKYYTKYFLVAPIRIHSGIELFGYKRRITEKKILTTIATIKTKGGKCFRERRKHVD